MMALRKAVILRSPRSGRLEGRNAAKPARLPNPGPASAADTGLRRYDEFRYASAGSATLALVKAGITSVAKRSSCSRHKAFGTPTDRLTETRSRPG